MKYDYNYIFSLLQDFKFGKAFYSGSETEKLLREHFLQFPEIKIRTGVSKFVCIPQNTNYVIKIPFNMTIDDWDDNEIPQYFIGATPDITDEAWDYCALEIFLYQCAHMNNIDCAFPQTEYIGLINGWPIYIQEKCLPSAEYSSPYFPTKHQKESAMSIMSPEKYFSISSDWLGSFYCCYGEEKTQTLIDFINFYKINDLHNSNIGYAATDSRPVILGFSGFKM